tara:strand:+ start:5511 stop:6191 length:681 start_codon:yes stop_codon:yes gene_type:complete
MTCNVRIEQYNPRLDLKTFNEPVIFKNAINDWKALDEWNTLKKFCDRYSHHSIYSKRASFSYNYNTIDTKLTEYCKHSHKEHIIVMDDNKKTANEDIFLSKIANDFYIPKLFDSITHTRILSFGGGFRGVDFMQHCSAWIGMISGRKLWQFADPKFKYIDTSCDNQSNDHRIKKCIVNKTDVVYVPDMWWHATCNLDPYTIAIGTQCQGKQKNGWSYSSNMFHNEL